MILEFIPEDSFGQPLRVKVHQVLLYNDAGTPIYVAAEYGPKGALRCAMVTDPDFNQILAALGVNMTVVCDTLSLPKPPAGARLIAGPR